MFLVDWEQIECVDEDKGLIIIRFEVGQLLLHISFGFPEDAGRVDVCIIVKITCVSIEQIPEESLPEVKLEPVEVKFLEFWVHVASFKYSQGYFGQILLLVLEHRHHLLHRSCHICVELLQQSTGYFRMIQYKNKRLLLQLFKYSIWCFGLGPDLVIGLHAAHHWSVGEWNTTMLLSNVSLYKKLREGTRICVFLGFSCQLLILFYCFFGLSVAIWVGKQANTSNNSGIREDKSL